MVRRQDTGCFVRFGHTKKMMRNVFLCVYFWKQEYIRYIGKIVRTDNRLILLYLYMKVLKVKLVYQQMTLSPNLGVVEISTLISSAEDGEDCIAKFTSLVRARD